MSSKISSLKSQTSLWDNPKLSHYRTIIWASLGATIFLLPFLYLTRISEVWEFPKIFVLALGLTVAGVTWLIAALKTGRWLCQFGRFELWLSILFGLSLLSTLFSVHPYTSLFGINGTQGETLIALALFIFLAIAIKTTFNQRASQWLLILLMGSFGLAVLMTIFHIGGVAFYPAEPLSERFLLTGSSPGVLALLLAIGWLVAWQLKQTLTSSTWRVLIDLFLAVCLVLFILLDSLLATILLIAGIILYAVIKIINNASWQKEYWLPIAFLVCLLLFVFKIDSTTGIDFDSEITLPTSTALATTAQTIASRPILGSGPATFYYDFIKHRPDSFNLLTISELRFVRADTYWPQFFSTYGTVAGLLFIVFLGGLIFRGLDGKNKKTKSKKAIIQFTPVTWLLAWTVLGLFLTSGSMMYLLWLWVAIGLFAAQMPQQKPSVKKPGLPVAPVVVVLLITMVGGWYFLGRVWLAPFYVAKANQAITEVGSLDQINEYFNQAIELDPWNPGYRFHLAENYLVQLQLNSQNTGADANLLTELAGKAIESADKGISLDPRNPALIESRIQLVSLLNQIIPDIDSSPLSWYEHLTVLEPNKASHYVELGKAQLIVSQETLQADSEADVTSVIQSALANFDKALEMKPGDVNARYHQAITQEILGNRELSKSLLKDLAIEYPNEIDILFELARQERLDDNAVEAIRLLSQAIQIAPSSVTIQLELVRAYEANSNYAEAIAILEQVQKAYPETTEITEWISQLQGKLETEANE